MKLVGFKKDKFESLVRFDEKVYPARDKVAEFIRYNFYNNPVKHESVDNIFLAEDDNGGIIGQFFLIHTFFFNNGVKNKGFWGIDFMVDETHRGSIAGAVLAKTALRNEYYFTMGPSESSLKIHLALKHKVIGSIVKYMRLNSVFTFLKILVKSRSPELSFYHFPDSIKTPKGSFKRVFSSNEIISKNGFWNSDSLEFIRDKEFIDWRFFYYKDKYYVYKYLTNQDIENSTPVYFVVRPVCWKNVNYLLLVDYRYNLDNEFHFNEILKAVVLLMKSVNLSGVIMGSSVKKHKKQLNRKLFFSFGEKIHIVTKFNVSTVNITDCQDRLMLTFADCDCDYYFGNKKW